MKKFIKKNISLILIIISAIIGITLGLCSNVFPSEVKETLSNGLFSTFQNIYVKVIGYVAGPIIFLTIALSIYDMKDFKTLCGKGRRYLLSYVAIIFVASAITTLVCLPIMGIKVDLSSSSKSTLSEIGDLFKNFIPDDFLSPFINVALVQIDVLAILIGITLLACGDRAAHLVTILNKIRTFLGFLMKIIAYFIPLYILVALTNTLWNNAPSTFSSLWKLLVTMIGFSVIACLVLLFITASYQKCRVSKLFKNAFKPYLVGLTTANTIMALPKHVDAGKDFGVSKTEAHFATPLSISLFKVSSAIYLACCATYFYSLSNSTVGITWIISTMILSTILSFSVAPVPGGGINNGAVLFNNSGINISLLPIFIALDPFVDFIITGFNNFMMPIQNLNVASKNRQVNKNILKDNKVILISGAMDVETDYLISQLENSTAESLDQYAVNKGTINGKNVIVLRTDIGTYNAAKSISLAIEKYQPTELISIGTSGGHHEDVHRGDIIISKKLINYDAPGMPSLSPDKDYISKYLALSNSKLGTILTSDTWHKSKEEINKIHKETDSDVEEMESFIACDLADSHNIKNVAIRIVSNNEINKEEYIRETGINLQKELLKVL